ncbi:hypothetical protein LEMLEM_LOCUS8366 [Lemmus lemmus]
MVMGALSVTAQTGKQYGHQSSNRVCRHGSRSGQPGFC